MALTSTTPVESGSSSFKARVPRLVVSCFDGEADIVTTDEVERVVGLTGCGGFAGIL